MARLEQTDSRSFLCSLAFFLLFKDVIKIGNGASVSTSTLSGCKGCPKSRLTRHSWILQQAEGCSVPLQMPVMAPQPSVRLLVAQEQCSWPCQDYVVPSWWFIPPIEGCTLVLPVKASIRMRTQQRQRLGTTQMSKLQVRSGRSFASLFQPPSAGEFDSKEVYFVHDSNIPSEVTAARALICTQAEPLRFEALQRELATSPPGPQQLGVPTGRPPPTVVGRRRGVHARLLPRCAATAGPSALLQGQVGQH